MLTVSLLQKRLIMQVRQHLCRVSWFSWKKIKISISCKITSWISARSLGNVTDLALKQFELLKFHLLTLFFSTANILKTNMFMVQSKQYTSIHAVNPLWSLPIVYGTLSTNIVSSLIKFQRNLMNSCSGFHIEIQQVMCMKWKLTTFPQVLAYLGPDEWL